MYQSVSYLVVLGVFQLLICFPAVATAQSAHQETADSNNNMKSFQDAGLVPQILAQAPANILEVTYR
jgi:hypothetical protein